MALKKKPSEPWPLITGEYEAGNPESPVAVCSCGSHLKGSELMAAGRRSGWTVQDREHRH